MPGNIDPTNSQDLNLLLIGAFIAFLSSNIVEFIKNWLQRREKNKNFKLFTRLELQVVTKTLDKLQAGLSYGSIYDYNLLKRAEESVGNLDKVRTEAIYLSDNELKEKFVDVLSDVLTFISKARSTQDIFYDEQRQLNNFPNSIKNDTKKNEKQTTIETNPQTSSVKSAKEMWEAFNQRSVQRTIEYIDIKRRLEELIDKLK